MSRRRSTHPACVPLHRQNWHGDWNYRLHPGVAVPWPVGQIDGTFNERFARILRQGMELDLGAPTELDAVTHLFWRPAGQPGITCSAGANS